MWYYLALWKACHWSQYIWRGAINRHIHNQGLSQFQTDDGGNQHLRCFFIHRAHSLMTLTKIRMDCFSTTKNSAKVRVSSNSGSAMFHWTVYRSEGNKQCLNGLTNQNKSISSIYLIFWRRETKIWDQPSNWKVAIWMDLPNILCFFYVFRYQHLHSYWVIIYYISFLRMAIEKNWQPPRVRNLEGAAISRKSVILCTFVESTFEHQRSVGMPGSFLSRYCEVNNRILMFREFVKPQKKKFSATQRRGLDCMTPVFVTEQKINANIIRNSKIEFGREENKIFVNNETRRHVYAREITLLQFCHS
jgi:hypothetical protein